MSKANISAVATVNQKDLLFSVNQDYSLTYYESQTQDESKRQQYLSKTIDVGGDTVFVNTQQPVVSAVAYRDPNSQTEEVRVYYFSSNLGLRELVRSGGPDKPWKTGDLNNQYDAKPTSGLSANVVAFGEKDVGQLKVYFSSAAQAGGALTCVYSNLGKGNWSPHNKITGV